MRLGSMREPLSSRRRGVPMACTQGPSSVSHVARALAISSRSRPVGVLSVAGSLRRPVHLSIQLGRPAPQVQFIYRAVFVCYALCARCRSKKDEALREGDISIHPAGSSGSRSPGRPSPHTAVQVPVRGDESDASVHISYAHMVLPVWVSGPFSRVCSRPDQDSSVHFSVAFAPRAGPQLYWTLSRAGSPGCDRKLVPASVLFRLLSSCVDELSRRVPGVRVVPEGVAYCPLWLACGYAE
ncbi:hypothetical protein BGZ61DRAFT_476277 [Ilyonectria robusta]|uniref:uncharacterized protein n=1 Tax=Ilyonectria robusta TaxID=1079257 RepID=UPI001E8D7B88|nr:uncharacterized protein BGZ61DRAFT_476277 [Ilyonectria robusta]KAH8714163.1 hypothetical protein BGZ61DRAFT_476277 [Ilyonectria robusta]